LQPKPRLRGAAKPLSAAAGVGLLRTINAIGKSTVSSGVIMKNTPSHTTSTHKLERSLTVIGIVLCLIACVLVWLVFSAQQSMWPLPDLYLLEMIVASIIGTWGIWGNESRLSPLRGILTWVVVGILFAFVVMGILSVGFLFAPVAVLFVIAAILSDLRQGHNLVLHMGIGFIAALAQAALMLAAIRLLYP
jgi:hypothetical protein